MTANTLSSRRRLPAVLIALCCAVPAISQSPPVVRAHNVGWTSAASGTGPSPAIAEVRLDLPGYTVYRPRSLPAGRLPLVVWGNGACRDNGLQHAQFLREIASHGFYVIALGAARQERAVGPAPASPPAAPTPPAPPRNTVDETQTAQMIAAIDWAARPPADLADHVDGRRVAVMGHSCGGLQAIAASADPRVTTTLIFDSGVYNRPIATNRSNVTVAKADLAKLHAPIAYFIGGPSDIAYANAMDDVAHIRQVPLFLGQLPVGHDGTFWKDADGGQWARAAAGWLAWQLQGDRAAARMFVGPDCTLCREPPWSVDNTQLGGTRPSHEP